MKILKVIALLTAAVVVALTARNLLLGDRRRIQRQLDALAQSASVSAAETAVQRLARASRLGAFFAEDVMIRTDQNASSFVGGRQAVMELAAQAPAAYGPIKVSLDDVQIGISESSTASVYVTVNVTANGPEGRLLETRQVSGTLRKVDGEWLISQVEVLAPSARVEGR